MRLWKEQPQRESSPLSLTLKQNFTELQLKVTKPFNFIESIQIIGSCQNIRREKKTLSINRIDNMKYFSDKE